MNAFTESSQFTISAPEAAGMPAQDEVVRTRLFDQFNAFWLNAIHEGAPYDMIGTMSVTAAIYGLLAKHGTETTAGFLDGLASDIRSGMFSIPRPN
ncbi:hypothetical protein GE253_18990 [Niveispirillum sp. SYP-B3756]|uniref:hypothetical protein n=1 Tax=Niveispirillum sp. SYP-B3756 TaxID=2662178 RepID=UPI001291F08B|nr:hypothetical protein [Niveispirillum sp. SYP-B3756]MQP67416.1 hypothetical protein [Niveispirillum sp. SYP-B3756]